MKITPIFLLLSISFSCLNIKKENQTIFAQIEKTQTETDRDSIINYAQQYLGTPYLYAGNDPYKGFDCSGFVSYVFHHFDINLPRSSSGYKNIRSDIGFG
ncbi:NlpC/P60 family protein [Flavobacterium piscis]|uniref:Cell wall-associated NlpC family hydrolase n=1 Tax=Flavobacterium piscis TaxID=1114874 RepID=A0ABU1Y8R7_9FLAO|nr:NlpC/P60 family protein [Flavobacterium piscis]MDR7210632.1 cell wall-associated NlpC family hydrolase [Flavobacterium piscis]